MGISQTVSKHVADVVIDVPPVNALSSKGWFELADVLRASGSDPDVNAVLLRAEGRGFCAGVDIKALDSDPTNEELIAVNRGCAEAFAAVYECAVPVVAAVHGFCLGGGIGLVGNADIVVASEDATFGLPELARGALGAATHLGRLVPPKEARWMLYSGSTASAQDLRGYGSVMKVVSREDLVFESRLVAEVIADQHPRLVRAAKEALNGIDPVDVRRSYRFEQGFTFELNLTDVPDEARRAFVEKRDPDFGS
ncbi:MAG: enoyl-CoA hydratase family protein [Actinomycetota bacterium]